MTDGKNCWKLSLGFLNKLVSITPQPVSRWIQPPGAMHTLVFKGWAGFQPFLSPLAHWALKLVKARVAQFLLCDLEQISAPL